MTKTHHIIHGALAAAGLSLAAFTASANTEQVAATEAGNTAIVRAAFDAWASQTGSVFDILSPDIVWTIQGTGSVAGTYTGRESFLEDASLPLVTRLSQPIVPEVHHIWAVDDHVIIRFDGTATTTSGAPYENQFVWLFRMQDGLVVEAEALLDLIAYQTVVENNEPRAE
jgi:uncharacterized protein